MAGAVFIDQRMACPTTGELCPARKTIVDDYTTTVDQALAWEGHVDFDSPLHPRFDQAKMQARLLEHSVQAMGRRCAGIEAEVCPVRDKMDQSSTRQGVVSMARVAINRLRKNT